MDTPLRLERFICEMFYQSLYKRAAEASATELSVLEIEAAFRQFLNGPNHLDNDQCYYNDMRRCLGRYAKEQTTDYVIRLDAFTSVLRKHEAKLNVIDVAELLAKQVALRVRLQESTFNDSDVEVLYAKVRRSFISEHYMVVKKGTPAQMFYSQGTETAKLSLEETRNKIGNVYRMLVAAPYVSLEFRGGQYNGRVMRLPDATKLLIK